MEFISHNPANLQETVAKSHGATSDEIVDALARAKEAQRKWAAWAAGCSAADAGEKTQGFEKKVNRRRMRRERKGRSPNCLARLRARS